MIRYRKLGYVELNVTDLDRSRRFYEEVVGLQPVDSVEGRARFRCDAEHYSVVLHQHPAAGLRASGFMLENDAQFEVLHQRLRGANTGFRELTPQECEDKNLRRVTRMTETFSRAVVEFYLPQPAAGSAFTATHTKIQRLGHVVFKTPQRVKSVEFFRDVLNFRESDSIGEGITFTRPFPSPYHHGLGIAAGAKPQFHHLNFMVTEFDDIGKGFNRFNRLGVPIVFGPGRHPASGSAFLYFLEPDGMTLEYSFGMEEFDEFNPRAAQTLKPSPEAIDSWGSPQDPRFATVGEIAELA
jgi:2,3-dihydroxy-p-cumate/2,3-dihydroxybenzoate 3,4-dioxygenase